MARIGFDVGGTFTDFVLQADDGRLHTAKLLTTYPDPSDACLAGLDDIVARADVGWSDVEQAVHGTTLGSNLVIERKGGGTALVTTRGFRDVLLIGREKRYQVYDLQIDKPDPLVDRAGVHELTERILADGTVRTPLDEDETRDLLRRLRDEDVSSLAVCFLHSYLNDAHERRFAAIAAEEAPDVVLSLSSEVSAQFREYERTSTTVVNAYLIRAVRDYLRRMSEELNDRGYKRPLFIMQSGGGIATAETMADHPVRMIESGPAAGALVAARFGELTGDRDLVAFDMGGTTAKLSLVRDGQPSTVESFELHRVDLVPGSGIPMSMEALDLVEIGAGGGSIARAEMGTIRVGPESAGSSPGPVCYGRGGTEVTVTDANLVLGYLDPGTFAGGTMALDGDAARAAVERDIAKPLGMSVEEAAWGIHRIVNLNMELATRVVSIERGHDPRALALVATGGAGPAHGVRLAAALGMPRVVLPAAAGVASAIGLLAADARFAVARTAIVRLGAADPEEIDRLFREMEEETTTVVEEATGAAPTRIVREAEVRYVGQGYTVTTSVPDGRVDADAVRELRRRFDAAYEQRYGYANPDQETEAATWKLTAYGAVPTVLLPELTATSPLEDARVAHRPAWFPETSGYAETPVYRRERLAPEARIEGPAIIVERESTTVLPPGQTGAVDRYGNLIVELEA